MKNPWYTKSWIIAVCFTLWFVLGIPLIIGIVLLIIKIKQEEYNIQTYNEMAFELARYKEMMTHEINDLDEYKEL